MFFNVMLFQGALARKVALTVKAPGRVVLCVVIVKIDLARELLLTTIAVIRMSINFMLAECVRILE